MDFLTHLVREAEERAAKYREYRAYYDGEHKAQITDRQREYLQTAAGQVFSANYCGIVVDSLANRLSLNGFDADDSEILLKWWDENSMLAQQTAVHVGAIRDGDSMVLVEWDDMAQRPVMTPQLAYDGRDGAQIHYDASTGKPVAATKRWWIEWGPDAAKIRRMNVYEPHRIARYFSSSETESSWMPWARDSFPAVIDWTLEGGEPIGIPLIHFTNRARGYTHGLSELEPAIPMQNALNKSVIDLLAAADASGFRILFLVGDDASELKVHPGVIINSQRDKDEADLKVFPGEDLRPLIEVVDSFVQRVGQVTDTPLSYFQLSGQMASEGTHRAHESRLLAKARVVSREMDVGWEKASRMALRLSNAFGGTSYDDMQKITGQWASFDTRPDVEKIKEKAEALELLVTAGAGIKQAALVAGFTEEQAEKLAEIDGPATPQQLAALGITPQQPMGATNATANPGP